MENSKFYLFITTVFLIPLILVGQGEILIKGKVTDNMGKLLIDVNVKIVDEKYGSATDENGDYVFKLPSGYADREMVLEVQHVGFISQHRTIELTTGINRYDFRMERDIQSLKPIIVTAQRREENLQNVPVAISAIENKDLRNRPASP